MTATLTRPPAGLDLLRQPIVPAAPNGLRSVHLLCGAGGDARGFHEAGFTPIAGANHTAASIAILRANFPDALDLCVELGAYDMADLPSGFDVLVGSPICTEASPASGKVRGRRVRQEALIPRPGEPQWTLTRVTAECILRAATIHRPRAVVCENVVDFATDWEGFESWLADFEKIGYEYTITSVSAAHIYSPGNPPAAQLRDRLIIVFTRRGARRPDMAPRPAAWCTRCAADVLAVQDFDAGCDGIGVYLEEYVYRCPAAGCGQLVEPYVLGADTAVDCTQVGRPIGDRAKPLADNTIARITDGIRRYPGEPVLMIPYYTKGVAAPITRPTNTLTTRDRYGLLHVGDTLGSSCYRMFTAREQARIQRFPDEHYLPGTRTEQIIGIGNAVPVNVARWVAERVAAVL